VLAVGSLAVRKDAGLVEAFDLCARGVEPRHYARAQYSLHYCAQPSRRIPRGHSVVFRDIVGHGDSYCGGNGRLDGVCHEQKKNPDFAFSTFRK